MEDWRKRFLEIQIAKTEADQKNNEHFKAELAKLNSEDAAQPEPEPEPIPEPTPAPEAPKNIRFKDIGYDELTIEWDAVEGAEKYRVYNLDLGQPEEETETTELSYTDKGLIVGKEVYHYAVEAINEAGSSISEFVEVETLIPEEEPENPADKQTPTEENPLVAEIIFNTATRLKWISVENAEKYRVEIRPSGGGRKSFVRLGETKETTYLNDRSSAGYKADYRVIVTKTNGEQTEVGFVHVEVPETPEIANPEPFVEIPKEYTDDISEERADAIIDEIVKYVIDKGTKYTIEIPESDEDMTNFINEEIASIPNGDVNSYSVIQFDAKKRVRAEGDLANNLKGWKGIFSLAGRSFMIFTTLSGKPITFYSTSPAVPHDSSISEGTHSSRANFKLRHCNNLWFDCIRVEGANTIEGAKIGTTPELTPDFWYTAYRKPYDITNEEGEVIKHYGGSNVPEWFLEQEGVSLEDLKEGDIVPRHPDNGSVAGAAVFHGVWEQEHAWDVRNSKYVRFTNCSSFGTFGDSIYVHDSEHIDILNCTSDFTGRQSFGFSNGAKHLKIFRSYNLRPRRASLDFEPMKGSLYARTILDPQSTHEEITEAKAALDRTKLDHIEVAYCHLESHVAAGGNGVIDNFNYHHNITPRGGSIRWLSREGLERKNLSIVDNTSLGSHHSSATANTILRTENVAFERNVLTIGTNQGRHAILIQDCTGEIRVVGNDWGNPAIVEIVNSGDDVIVEGNTPDVPTLRKRGETEEIPTTIIR